MSGSTGQPTMGWFPWQAEFSKVGANWARGNDSLSLGMGYLFDQPASQNDEIVWNVYLDSVTWKFPLIYNSFASAGIATIQLDGSTVGTIDMYSAGTTRNVYSEITGIAVATPGVKAMKVLLATKNASSTRYDAILQSLAWIQTSGTNSTPAGTDTPGYTWQYFPWMGVKTPTPGTWVRAQSSGEFGGGEFYNSSAAQNDAWATGVWLDSGTYKFPLNFWGTTATAICTVKVDGVSVGTIDTYQVAGLGYAEITGATIASATTQCSISYTAATKNVLSSGYTLEFLAVAAIRTGA